MSHVSVIWGKVPPWGTEQWAARLKRQGWNCGKLQANGFDGLCSRPLLGSNPGSWLDVSWELMEWPSGRACKSCSDLHLQEMMQGSQSSVPGSPGLLGSGAGWLATPLPPSHIRTVVAQDKHRSAQTAHQMKEIWTKLPWKECHNILTHFLIPLISF